MCTCDASWHGESSPSPVRLHHCDGTQFVAFGEFLMSLQDDTAGDI